MPNGLVPFTLIVVTDELSCISAEFRLKPVIREVLIEAILPKVACLSRVVSSLSKKETKLVVRYIKSTPKVEAVVTYLILRKGDLFRVWDAVRFKHLVPNREPLFICFVAVFEEPSNLMVEGF